ncbi:MAG TPA: translation elongation factor Ts [Candidatus Paceibacterota bacterium]|nr:translation elongation factor Ts [Candidatus Paceibacterota bacterium]
MSTVSVEKIKQLRDLCGISLGACRKALEETGGNLEKALESLKKSSADVALRKAERATSDGAVFIKKAGDKTAVVILNCETDFVAKNENFLKLASDLADIALKEGIPAAKAKSREQIDAAIQKTGENIQLKNIELVPGKTASYVHGGKIGAVVTLAKDDEKLAKDIAMHVTALRPEYLALSDIPAERMAEMKAHYGEEVAKLSKPEAIKERIIKGKLDEYFKQFTLLEQSFIKEDKTTVGELLKKAGNSVTSFALYTL